MYGETLAIDDYEESSGDEGEDASVNETSNSWAHLIPLNSHLKKHTLNETSEKYIFGKDENCHVIFEPDCFSESHLALISKRHFIIHKQACSSDPNDYDVVLEDISSNGTLVNGKKVGKNKFQVLQANDEISLALHSIKVFMYVNVKGSAAAFHSEVTDKYLISKLLGKGACGEVFLVFLEADYSKQFAMKVVDKKSFTSSVIEPSATESGVLRNSASDVMSEVNILKKLRHPCIIHVQEVFDFSDRLYLVLERAMGGELFDRVVKNDGLAEPIAKLFFYQMLQAIDYLHNQNVTHRDLKPENILLATDDDQTLIKVTDFGLSKLVGEQSLMKTLCGTPNYLAPEIIKTSGMGHYNSKVDIWSLGVILFIMLAGYPPFSNEYEDLPLVEQIKKARFSFSDESWNSVSKNAKNLVSKLIVANANKRLTSTQALNHPWLKDEEMRNVAHELMKQDMNRKEVTTSRDVEESENGSSSVTSSSNTTLVISRENSSENEECAPAVQQSHPETEESNSAKRTESISDATIDVEAPKRVKIDPLV